MQITPTASSVVGKSHSKGLRENPEGFLNLIRESFRPITPHGLTSSLKVLLTGEEKATIFSKAQKEADKENKNNASHAGNQTVPDNKPNWDHQYNGEWGGRQRLTHYKIMVLKGIQAKWAGEPHEPLTRLGTPLLGSP